MQFTRIHPKRETLTRIPGAASPHLSSSGRVGSEAGILFQDAAALLSASAAVQTTYYLCAEEAIN